MADSFATRDRLDVNGKSYAYSSLAKLGERFDLARLPYSMKILLENLLRHEDGRGSSGGSRRRLDRDGPADLRRTPREGVVLHEQYRCLSWRHT